MPCWTITDNFFKRLFHLSLPLLFNLLSLHIYKTSNTANNSLLRSESVQTKRLVNSKWTFFILLYFFFITPIYVLISKLNKLSYCIPNKRNGSQYLQSTVHSRKHFFFNVWQRSGNINFKNACLVSLDGGINGIWFT